MKIAVKNYQSSTIAGLITSIKERMLGWCTEDQSFYFKEANGSEYGLMRRIPSIIGNGTNVKITIPGHSLVKNNLVRLNDSGYYTSAVASNDNSANATHFVFDVDGNDVYLTQKGSWLVSGLARGRAYLSTSANTMTSTYTGVEQSIGICDGKYLHLNFNENKTTQKYNKILTIGSPMVGMDFTLLYTSNVSKLLLIKAVINGTGSSNIEIAYSQNRDLTGSVTQVGTTTVSSVTTGDTVTLLASDIPVDSYVVLKVTGVTGSPDSIETIIVYEEQ